MSKHTPGPWMAVKCKVDGADMISIQENCGQDDDSDLSICGIYNLNDKTKADARLIAAAPDLLEALKRCKFDSLNMSLADLEFCRAAYLKATGGQP